MKDEVNMHFSSRKYSKPGIIGFLLSVLCAVLIVALCIVSIAKRGAAGSIVGVIGVLAMLGSGTALFLCYKGLHQQDVFTKLPTAGLITSAADFLILFCIYITGI